MKRKIVLKDRKMEKEKREEAKRREVFPIRVLRVGPTVLPPVPIIIVIP
jgi:hypothetical protein